MSLTGHLTTTESLVGNCIKHVLFPNTKEVLKRVRQEPASLVFIEPPAKPYPYMLAGTAFDYRLRFCLERTPLDSLVAYRGSRILDGTGGTITTRMPDGTWSSGPVQSPEFVNRFWASLQLFLDTARPERRKLDEEDDRRLAQYCLVLAKFEAFFRSGVVDQILENTRFRKVEHLLALMPEPVVDDLCRLARGFHDHGLPYFGPDKRLALNPTFTGSEDVGGADADLIVGTCLVDIKTTIDPAMKGAYLHQLLGYVLLDYEDAHAIDEVAVFSARYCRFHRWPLDALVREMSGNPEMTVAKARKMLRTAIAAEAMRQGETGRPAREGPSKPVSEPRQPTSVLRRLWDIVSGWVRLA